MRLNRFQKIFLVFWIILFLLIPFFVFADITFKPEAIPGGEQTFKAGGDPGAIIFGYFAAIYSWAVPAIGVIAVVMIMIAGFQWMIAGGNATKVSAAKTRMTNSIAGLILVIGAYWMLNFINPALVEAPKLTLKTVETKELKFPDPAEMVEARVKMINKECKQTSDCQGTPEEPVYDLFCDHGKCKMKSGSLAEAGSKIQCMGYGGTCKKDEVDIKDEKPLGCCDKRLKCIKIAGGSGVTGWFVKDVKTCLPSQ